jgi:hypothetical protein
VCETLRDCLTQREEKDFCSRRYWIGGEGLPFGDRVREKRE